MVDQKRAITAALYLRLSRDDGGDLESNSIGNQRSKLQLYAKEHGFIVYSEYVEACDIIEPKSKNPDVARDSAILVQNFYSQAGADSAFR
jgi:DNA invertase Pin-like site-specific DNA recombinase